METMRANVFCGVDDIRIKGKKEMNIDTWSPFQSVAVQQICAHMTDLEKREAAGRSFFYGLWVTATVAGPFSFLLLTSSLAVRAAAVALMLVHIASIPTWLKMQRRFLCSLSWAKEQDITPERLNLFKL